jgi:hypothetical protein
MTNTVVISGNPANFFFPVRTWLLAPDGAASQLLSPFITNSGVSVVDEVPSAFRPWITPGLAQRSPINCSED